MTEGGMLGGDQSSTRRRYTVNEAAEILGLTVEAIRGRIKRDKIEHERTEEGNVYVLLPPLDTPGQSTSQQPVNDMSVDQSELVKSLQEQINYLRQLLDQEREARTEERRRHDTVLAQLSQANAEQARTIRAIEPAPETPESSETPAEGEDTTAPSDDTGEPRRPSFWRRFFGLE
jgi:hypothetical protein